MRDREVSVVQRCVLPLYEFSPRNYSATCVGVETLFFVVSEKERDEREREREREREKKGVRFLTEMIRIHLRGR